MSATVVLDSKAGDDTKVVIRPDLKRNGNPKPSDEEIARCGPLRMVIVVVFCLGLIGMLVAAIVIIAISPRCSPKKPPVPISWWKKEHFYSIHVPSFLDTDSDGFGDLTGVSNRLDYLKQIGGKTIVLSGIVNPKNLKEIDPKVGTSDSFKKLVKSLKDENIKAVVSINPTSTSTEHLWFIESRNKTTAKRSFYVWSSKQENNWVGKDKGTAWHKDDKSSGFYYSYYGKNSAALDFNNPTVQATVREVLEHWLTSYGVKGFFIEGASRLAVDSKFRDSTGSVDYSRDQPETHKILKSWNKLLEKHDAVLLGAPDSSNSSSYFGSSSEKELDVVLSTYFATSKQAISSANMLNNTILTQIASVPTFAWPGWVVGGINFQRLASRYNAETAKLLVIMHLTLPGTIVSYYGDELLLKDQGTESASIMQWNNGTNAGFSQATAPWLTPNSDYVQNNVQKNSQENGLLKIFKELSMLRSKELSLSGPQFEVVYASQKVIIYYRAQDGGDKYLVALNFGSSPVSNVSLAYNKLSLEKGVVLLDTTFKLTGKILETGKLPQLSGGHGLIIRIPK